MCRHEEIVEEVVSLVSCRAVEALLGATGPRDQLGAILEIAVLDHVFCPDFAVGRVDNRAGGAFLRHPLAVDALAQLRPRRSGAS
jgi:hypothetical protein